MGQYHYVCNLDKREYLHPHRFGDGLKLMEFGNSMGGTLTALTILLGASNGRGGGDLHISDDHPLAEVVGSWAGDRIAIIGDYFEEGDVPGWDINDNPWENEENWAEISGPCRSLIEEDGMFTFEIEESIWKDTDGNETVHQRVVRT